MTILRQCAHLSADYTSSRSINRRIERVGFLSVPVHKYVWLHVHEDIFKTFGKIINIMALTKMCHYYEATSHDTATRIELGRTMCEAFQGTIVKLYYTDIAYNYNFGVAVFRSQH